MEQSFRSNIIAKQKEWKEDIKNLEKNITQCLDKPVLLRFDSQSNHQDN